MKLKTWLFFRWLWMVAVLVLSSNILAAQINRGQEVRISERFSGGSWSLFDRLRDAETSTVCPGRTGVRRPTRIRINRIGASRSLARA